MGCTSGFELLYCLLHKLESKAIKIDCMNNTCMSSHKKKFKFDYETSIDDDMVEFNHEVSLDNDVTKSNHEVSHDDDIIKSSYQYLSMMI